MDDSAPEPGPLAVATRFVCGEDRDRCLAWNGKPVSGHFAAVDDPPAALFPASLCLVLRRDAERQPDVFEGTTVEVFGYGPIEGMSIRAKSNGRANFGNVVLRAGGGFCRLPLVLPGIVRHRIGYRLVSEATRPAALVSCRIQRLRGFLRSDGSLLRVKPLNDQTVLRRSHREAVSFMILFPLCSDKFRYVYQEDQWGHTDTLKGATSSGMLTLQHCIQPKASP